MDEDALLPSAAAQSTLFSKATADNTCKHSNGLCLPSGRMVSPLEILESLTESLHTTEDPHRSLNFNSSESMASTPGAMLSGPGVLEPEAQLMVELQQYEDEGEGDWLTSQDNTPTRLGAADDIDDSWLPSGESTPRSLLPASEPARKVSQSKPVAAPQQVGEAASLIADISHVLEPLTPLSERAAIPSKPSRLPRPAEVRLCGNSSTVQGLICSKISDSVQGRSVEFPSRIPQLSRSSRE